MINKTAFVALSLIMVVSWVFGIVCDKMITRWFNSLYKPQKTPERRSCDTCKYEYTKECADDDIDRWTPAELTRCSNCRYKDTSWYEEPCDSCTGDRWEANR